jgi:hypothetical protein
MRPPVPAPFPSIRLEVRNRYVNRQRLEPIVLSAGDLIFGGWGEAQMTRRSFLERIEGLEKLAREEGGEEVA